VDQRTPLTKVNLRGAKKQQKTQFVPKKPRFVVQKTQKIGFLGVKAV